MISFRQYLSETDIRDNGVYLANMQKSFPDKAWFVKYISPAVDTIVDFGGGTGDFCEFIRGKSKNVTSFQIIDNNPAFLSDAKTRGFEAYGSLRELRENGRYSPDTTLLNMSSVIHEIYSYADAGEVWRDVGLCGFRQIAIRDMNVTENDHRNVPVDAVCWAYDSIFCNPKFEVKGMALPVLTREFEDRWGAICDPARGKVNVKNLIHFLVKYRYVENWEREVNENYFPISQAKLESVLNGLGYSLTHKESSRLGFYADTWTKDFKLNRPDNSGFGIKLKRWLSGLNTHIKWMAELKT